MFKIKRKDFYSKIREIDNPLLYKMLSYLDPARLISLIRFYDLFSKIEDFSFNDHIKIAVISGSLSEPELIFFNNSSVDCLCFDENTKPGESQFWDLNLDWSEAQYSDFHKKYDLVLCEQVFEHIPNPEKALKNMKYLLKDRAMIHISVPSINGIHTDPYYFTAGYHKRMLSYLAKKVGGFEKIDCESWGSKKAVSMYALIDWSPLVASGDLRDSLYISSKFFNLKNFVKYFYHKVKYNFQSIWFYSKRDYPVIAWILLKKNKKQNS